MSEIPTDKEIFRNTLRHSISLKRDQTNEGEYVKQQLRKAQGVKVTKWIDGPAFVKTRADNK